MNRLEKDYNSPLSSKIKDPDFDSVVIKIQNDEISNITAEEHNACDNLRIDKNDGNNDNDNNDNDSYEKRRIRFKLR